MTILRIQHHRNYTCISNEAIRDSRLSFKARGIHHLLLSYPNNWEAKVEHLVEQSEKDGRSSVLSGLEELEECGYLSKEQLRDAKGRFVGWTVTVRETPEAENPTADLSELGLTNCGKSIPIINNDLPSKYPVNEVSTLSPSLQVEIEGEKKTSTGVTSNKQESEVSSNQPSIPTSQYSSGVTHNLPAKITKRPSAPIPTKEQLADIWQSLREIRLNPDDFVGLVHKWSNNALDAIAYVKQGIQQGWCKEPKALLRVALREGRKPETPISSSSGIPEEACPPTKEQTDLLEAAKVRGEIQDYFFSTLNGVGITKVVIPGLRTHHIPWWEFLRVDQLTATSHLSSG